MPDRSRSVPASVFEAKYTRHPDPWRYETRSYEARKYRATLEALPRKHYASALEIGCSIGVFTELLAARCDELLALDFAAQAVQRTRERCADMPQVRCLVARIPDQFPQEAFDLIVFSEVGYYLSRSDLVQASRMMIDRLKPGGQIVLVHWTLPLDDAPIGGDEVHGIFATLAGELEHVLGRREHSYRLDIYRRGTAG